MMSKQIKLLAEGDTEKKVFQSLGVMGSFKKFNIWQDQIKKILPSLPRDAHLQIYIDTDRANNQRDFNRFTDNIKTLEKARVKFKIYLQVQNLENELSRACTACIYTGFGISAGSSELKKLMLNCTNLPQKWQAVQIDTQKLWKQPHQKCDAVISQYR